MSRIGVVILREWRENLRQRWLVGTLALQLGLIALGARQVLKMIDRLAAIPEADVKLQYWSDLLGVPMSLDGITAFAFQGLNYLVLTQLLGMTAVIAGHAALHDRQCGTLPFLLLSPVHRGELLIGKVLGALSLPLAVYLVVGGGAIGWASTLPIAASQAGTLPPSPAWLIAFLLGAPAWATAIGAMCVGISSLAADVRTAQQAAWVLVFFASFVVGPLLVNLMAAGALVQLVVAGAGAGVAGVSLLVATQIVGRELGR